MRDLATDPPIAIRAVGVGAKAAMPFGSARTKRGAFGPMLRAILGFGEGPERAAFVTAVPELKGLSLEIEAGTAVAVVGGDGSAGALLRLLAGAIPLSAGRVEMCGPVASMLEIGDNLEPTQTALENIETQRRLRRIPVGEAKAFAEEVIAFAGLAGFEAIPVRKYSTGMRMRLSLSLVLHGRPAILLVDDVLGVGDAAFQKKCADRLLELKTSGCTLVMATSDEALVRQLAMRVVSLGDGGGAGDDLPSRCAEGEFGSVHASWRVASNLPTGQAAALKILELVERRERGDTFVDLATEYDIRLAPQRCRPLIQIMKGRVAVLRSVYPGSLPVERPGVIRFTAAVPIDLLPRGRYSVDVGIVSELSSKVRSLKARAAVALEVKRSAQETGAAAPLVSPRLAWEVEPVLEDAP
jgi:ABC-type polysaccharide/polyol phosphate transport system ATPase subunit